MNWETKEYGSVDGKITLSSNDVGGFERGKKQGGEYNGISIYYEHFNGEHGGATYITPEEAKDLYEALGVYIEFMSNEQSEKNDKGRIKLEELSEIIAMYDSLTKGDLLNYAQKIHEMNEELISLNLWSARRLFKSWKQFAYNELEEITGKEHERL